MGIVKGGQRHRYIGFIIQGSPQTDVFVRSSMVEAINQSCRTGIQNNDERGSVRLIRFDGKAGIVKCPQHLKNQVISVLQGITSISNHKVQVQTVATSGTIHALVKNPQLKNLIQTRRPRQ